MSTEEADPKIPELDWKAETIQVPKMLKLMIGTAILAALTMWGLMLWGLVHWATS